MDKNQIGNEFYDKKFGSFYENLNMAKFFNISYIAVFLLRRLGLAIVTVTLKEYPGAQV